MQSLINRVRRRPEQRLIMYFFSKVYPLIRIVRQTTTTTTTTGCCAGPNLEIYVFCESAPLCRSRLSFTRYTLGWALVGFAGGIKEALVPELPNWVKWESGTREEQHGAEPMALTKYHPASLSTGSCVPLLKTPEYGATKNYRIEIYLACPRGEGWRNGGTTLLLIANPWATTGALVLCVLYPGSKWTGVKYSTVRNYFFYLN